ncbi:hypothetical protein ARMSODRAFT_953788 [Armillaria solidipes]|uniref:AA9 family lytic polysaccharide monooxygenase n=1 Tax=Armillaria solidipes TaxID=1076256 RepID=A0A2H3BT44_9AGAR|nr:hypothetical protein ARMSODRAFT_953788 [Armillaria solidipes]
MAVDTLIANDGKVSSTIPDCIEPGQYLLRHELILQSFGMFVGSGITMSLSSYPGAQFYMECVQLKITGGGSTSPSTVSFPGAYASSDPGIAINIYQTPTGVTIPKVFSC